MKCDPHHVESFRCLFLAKFCKNLYFSTRQVYKLNVVLYLLQSSLKAEVAFLCLPPERSFKEYFLQLKWEHEYGAVTKGTSLEPWARGESFKLVFASCNCSRRTPVVKLVVESCWGEWLCKGSAWLWYFWRSPSGPRHLQHPARWD